MEISSVNVATESNFQRLGLLATGRGPRKRRRRVGLRQMAVCGVCDCGLRFTAWGGEAARGSDLGFGVCFGAHYGKSI